MGPCRYAVGPWLLCAHPWQLSLAQIGPFKARHCFPTLRTLWPSFALALSLFSPASSTRTSVIPYIFLNYNGAFTRSGCGGLVDGCGIYVGGVGHKICRGSVRQESWHCIDYTARDMEVPRMLYRPRPTNSGECFVHEHNWDDGGELHRIL
jgi:hypothetical protein